MKRGLAWLLVSLPLAGQAFAQSGAVIPQGGAGHAGGASCVILKRMGPADEVTSRLYSFGIRGKQFQYVEGKLPEGFPFHGRLTDHDVRNLQGRGSEVIILNQNYTSGELKEARDDCRGETGTTPNQAEPKPAAPVTTTAATPGASAAASSSAPATAPVAATTPSPSPASGPSGSAAAVAAGETATVDIKSTPGGGDISVDGSFVGNAPSTLKLAPGGHTIAVSASGFTTWQRKITVTAGSSVTLNAVLEKVQ